MTYSQFTPRRSDSEGPDLVAAGPPCGADQNYTGAGATPPPKAEPVTARDNPFHPLQWQNKQGAIFVVPQGTSKKALCDSASYMLYVCRDLLTASLDDLAGVPEGFGANLTNAAHILATLAIEQLQAAEVFP